MSKKDTLLALKNSGELKDEAKELLSNTISTLFGDPVAAVHAFQTIAKSPVIMRDCIFWGKYQMFLNGILEDDEDLRKLSAVFAENEDREEFSERILSAIDKIEAHGKIKYIIHLTISASNGFICKLDFYRLIWCIVNIPLEDLQYLSKILGRQYIFDNIHLRFLEKYCLVTRENTPLISQRDIDSGTDYCKYHITDFAIVLDKYGLNYGAEKYNYAEITPPLGEQNLRVPAGTTVGVVQGGENL